MGKLGLFLTIAGGICTVLGGIAEIHETAKDCREQFDEEMEDIRELKKSLEERTKAS